jgi:peptidoglycan/xylan/chitin deacetylase (PgdA/CDA1 family)
MMRQHLRSTLDRVASSAGLLRLCERRMLRGVTVLMYHRILPADQCRIYPLPSLVIPREVFAAQVAWLAAHCDVRTVAGALEAQRKSERRERPLVALTFDDGYQDNYTIAAPILEDEGCRGTFFVTTGFVRGGTPLWFDRAADAWHRLPVAERARLMTALSGGAAAGVPGGLNIRSWMEGLKRAAIGHRHSLVALAESQAEDSMDTERYLPMTIEQVHDLHARGHEIASHTVTHPLLPQLDDEALRSELVEAHRSITDWTGEASCGFCYPNGDVNERVARMVAEAGHTYACTTRPGLNRRDQDVFRLRRLSITMQRTTRAGGDHHALGFRGEISRMRELWRV